MTKTITPGLELDLTILSDCMCMTWIILCMTSIIFRWHEFFVCCACKCKHIVIFLLKNVIFSGSNPHLHLQHSQNSCHTTTHFFSENIPVRLKVFRNWPICLVGFMNITILPFIFSLYTPLFYYLKWNMENCYNNLIK